MPGEEDLMGFNGQSMRNHGENMMSLSSKEDNGCECDSKITPGGFIRCISTVSSSR